MYWNSRVSIPIENGFIASLIVVWKKKKAKKYYEWGKVPKDFRAQHPA